jgi:hypothetical protein
MWSKSRSSSNIPRKEGERERALSDASEGPQPTPSSSSSSALHTFQVTSKDNVPVPPKPEPPVLPTTKATSGDVVLTISKAENKVKEYRAIELKNGRVTVTNFPRSIIPQSVRFFSVNDPSAKVLTQILKKHDAKESVSVLNFLNEHIGQEINVNNPGRQMFAQGTLRGAASDSLFISTEAQKVQDKEGESGSSSSVPGGVGVVPILPENIYIFPQLDTSSTFTTNLEWIIDSKQDKHFAEISYGCSGLSWSMNFNGMVDSAFTTLHLTGWYQLENKAGTDFNAKVILVQNSSKAVDPKPNKNRKSWDAKGYEAERSSNKVSSMLSSFKKGGSFRTHQKTTTRRFQLPRKVILPNGEVVLEKAVDAIFPIKRFYLVKARKLKYSGILDTDDHGLSEFADVDQVISFENTSENGLGLTLPDGAFSLSQGSEEDDDSILDVCSTTLRLEDHLVLVSLQRLDRNQFSVLRKRTNFQHESKKSVMRETFDIVIDNNSSDPIFDLYVDENLFRWNEWDVTGAAVSTSKQGTNNRPVPFTDFTCEKHALRSHRISFYIPVVPDYTTVTITYTVVYNYGSPLYIHTF